MFKINEIFNDIYFKYVILEKFSAVIILKENQRSPKNNGF